MSLNSLLLCIPHHKNVPRSRFTAFVVPEPYGCQHNFLSKKFYVSPRSILVYHPSHCASDEFDSPGPEGEESSDYRLWGYLVETRWGNAID